MAFKLAGADRPSEVLDVGMIDGAVGKRRLARPIPDRAPQQNASCDMPATFGLPSSADTALRRENWRYAPRIDYMQEPAGSDAGAP
jgi:hypothetical protein